MDISNSDDIPSIYIMANGERKKKKRAADGKRGGGGKSDQYTRTNWILLVSTHTHRHKGTFFFFSFGMEPCNKLSTLIQTTPSVFLSPMFFGVGRIDPCFRRKPLCVCVCPPARSLDCFEPCTNIQSFNQKNGTSICSFLSARARPLPLAQVFRALNYYRGKGYRAGIHPWYIPASGSIYNL